MHTQSILVTGAGSGIGYETTALAVRHGVHVFAAVQNAQDQKRLQENFGSNITTLLFDVRDEKAVGKAAAVVREALGKQTLLGLVNNAGIGLAGPLLHQPMEDFRAVLETNVVGTVLVTRAFAVLLGASKKHTGRKGRVVNLGSIAGKVGQPFAGAYVASKHAVEGLSEALRRELSLYGIPLIVVAPATVTTPIWEQPESAIGRYADTDYGAIYDQSVRVFVDLARKHGEEPAKIAEIIWEALTARRPRRRYSPAQHPILEQVLPRFTPTAITDAVVENATGLKPSKRYPSGLEV